MIKLLSRKDILNFNPTFASYIINWQGGIYNPLHEHNTYKAGILWIDDRLATQEECDQLNQEALDDFLKRKDDYPAHSPEEKFKGEIVYSAKKTNLSVYPVRLADSLTELTFNLNWQPLIFLLDYSVPWLSQENDHKPVARALSYLRSLGIENDFTGGFLASGKELNEFLKNLFWLVRCNATLPICYFSGVEGDTLMYLCKYGNVHFEFYSEAEKIIVQREASGAKLMEVENGECYEEFTKTGFITGRQTKI